MLPVVVRSPYRSVRGCGVQGSDMTTNKAKYATLQNALLHILGLCLTFGVASAVAGSHGSSHHSSGHQYHVSEASPKKTEHVTEYQRKDGTVVHSYNRAPAGEGEHTAHVAAPLKKSHSSTAPVNKHYSLGHKEARSTAAKDAFKRAHPCPSTGRTSGACPGYVIDHVQALKHGGADAPSNMQWQTTAAAKEKDRWE